MTAISRTIAANNAAANDATTAAVLQKLLNHVGVRLSSASIAKTVGVNDIFRNISELRRQGWFITSALNSTGGAIDYTLMDSHQRKIPNPDVVRADIASAYCVRNKVVVKPAKDMLKADYELIRHVQTEVLTKIGRYDVLAEYYHLLTVPHAAHVLSDITANLSLSKYKLHYAVGREVITKRQMPVMKDNKPQYYQSGARKSQLMTKTVKLYHYEYFAKIEYDNKLLMLEYRSTGQNTVKDGKPILTAIGVC